MFDKQDIYHLLFQSKETPDGKYNHQTWTTFSGPESEATMVQLTSLHESFHNELNNLTIYGSTLIVYANLAQFNNEPYNAVINGLVSRCRQAHEIYATFLSCSVIANSLNKTIDIEKELLQNHPTYVSYYKQALKLTHPFKGSYLKELVLGSIIISCFQDATYIQSVLNDVSSFKINKIRNKHYPDARLAFIAKNLPKNFLKQAFDQFCIENSGNDGIKIFIETENNHQAYKKAIASKFDDLQQLLNNYLIASITSWLKEFDFKTLSLSSNLPLLKELYQKGNKLLSPNVRLLTLNEDAFNYERNVLLNFTAEKYKVRKEPLEAHLYALDSFDEEDWDKFSVGNGNDEHHFIVSRMPERMLEQFRFNSDSKEWLTSHSGKPLVFLRRRVINKSKNIQVVELFYISDVTVLNVFISKVNKPVVSNISLHTWAINKWAKEWMVPLSNNIMMSILFDLPPHDQLNNLFGKGSLVININKAWIKDKDYRHCALVIEPQIDEHSEGPIFFIPASLVTCNVISNYMLKQMKPVRVKKDDKFMNAKNWLIKVVMGHLFNETYYFDFNI